MLHGVPRTRDDLQDDPQDGREVEAVVSMGIGALRSLGVGLKEMRVSVGVGLKKLGETPWESGCKSSERLLGGRAERARRDSL